MSGLLTTTPPMRLSYRAALARTWDDICEMIQEAITFHLEDMTENGEPVPLPRMSVSEAMAHHIDSLAKAGEDVPDLETTFGMVEVEMATAASPVTPV